MELGYIRVIRTLATFAEHGSPGYNHILHVVYFTNGRESTAKMFDLSFDKLPRKIYVVLGKLFFSDARGPFDGGVAVHDEATWRRVRGIILGLADQKYEKCLRVTRVLG